MQSFSILALAATAASGLASAAPTPASASSAGSICHVLTYTGSCGNLTTISNSSSSTSASSSSSSSSCRYSNVCLVPSTPNATLLENSINALTGVPFLSGNGNNATSSSNSTTGQLGVYVNSTGFIDLAFSGAEPLNMPAQGVCDGERYMLEGTEMAYQCICNDIPDSCPDAGGAAVSISFANGTSSTSAIPANAGPSEFSWTWAPSSTPSGGVKVVNQTTISGVDATSTPTARTTFVGTFGSPPATTSGGNGQQSASGGIGAGGAAASGDGDKSGSGSRSYSISIVAITCSLLVGASAALALV